MNRDTVTSQQIQCKNKNKSPSMSDKEIDIKEIDTKVRTRLTRVEHQEKVKSMTSDDIKAKSLIKERLRETSRVTR